MSAHELTIPLRPGADRVSCVTLIRPELVQHDLDHRLVEVSGEQADGGLSNPDAAWAPFESARLRT